MNAPVSTEPIAVEDYVDLWLDHTAGRVRGTTLHGYESIMRIHVKPAVEGRDLDSLTPLDLQNLYSRLLHKERPLSAGTVLNLHLCLTQAFGQAVRWGYLAANPAKGAQPPRPRRKEPTAVDAALCGRIMEAAADTRFELVVAIALATGMRRGEILGLKWQDISADMTGAQVRRTLQSPKAGVLVFEEPKTKRSRRQVALPAFLIPHLVKQRAKQAAARTRLGDAWHENGVVVDWWTALIAIPLGVICLGISIWKATRGSHEGDG